ncbi:MAG: hypothetical protein Q8Q33_09455 [Chlamydiota bacterium]|nr:hypothetical protein [Chlamydiota bacterium]
MNKETIHQLDTRILDFIHNATAYSDDAQFQKLALDLFQYQYTHNAIYQHFCNKMGLTPNNVKRWEEIPALHTASFKEAAIHSTPISDKTVFFETSGTSTSKKGRHYFDSCLLYDAALIWSFKHYVLPDTERMDMCILFPDISELPHSSLAYMFSILKHSYGTEESKYYSIRGQLQFEALIKDIKTFNHQEKPLLLLGTTLGFAMFFQKLKESYGPLKLPPKSRIMDTGGSKGQQQEISRNELFLLSRKLLNIDEHAIINEYGMTEMSSQFYDSILFDRMHGLKRSSQKIPPPWVRSRVIASDAIHEVKIGEKGLLRHLDLANRNSVCSLQTEDIALRTEDGFELIGRPRTSELRGCSLLMEEL